MATHHPAIKTTQPGYQNNSELMLEVLFDDQKEWKKLKAAEPYNRNREVSLDNQIKQLESCRSSWISNGGTKYATAKYRIGKYEYFPEHAGYAFVPVTAD